MKKNCPSTRKRYLLTLAIAMASAEAHTAPAQIFIEDNELTISSGGNGTSFSQDVVVDATGTLDDIVDVPSTNGVGIPSFSFTILEAGSNLPAPSGPYQFAVGVVIDDQNSQRQMEAYIGNLQLNVAANGTVTGTIPVQSMHLYGRDGSGTITVDVTVPNAASNGPVKISGGSVSFDAVALLDKLRDNAIFENIILDEFDDESTYDFRIAVKQVSGASISFGTYEDPTFTAFPTNTTTPAFVLSTSAQGMASPYSVHGSFNVVFIEASTGGGDTGGGTPVEEVEGVDDLDDLADELAGQLEDLEDFEDLSEAELEAIEESINNAIADAEEVAEKAIEQTATLSTTAALEVFTTINKSLTNAGSASVKGGTVDTTSAVSTMNNLASALSNVTGRTLTSTEVTQVTTLATTTLTSATNLVKTGASTESILDIVKASSNILAQASKAAGAAVSPAIVTQVQELAKKSVGAVLDNLKTSGAVSANVDLTNPESVKTLMKENPAVLELAMAASASLPADATIEVGGVKLTREEIIALSLAGGGQTGTVLQGGFNFQAATTGFSVTTDSVTGNMTLSNGTEKYVAASPVSRLVPDSVPDGINYLPNGTAVLIGNGVATELAPTAFDAAGFTSAVSSAGFQLTYRSNGTISIALANNERFSAAFGYDNLGNAASCGAISITSPTGKPTDPGYAFTLTCANGPTQRVTPIPDNALFYTTVSKTGLNISTDRNTGIVTIATVGSFKPSFFVTPLSLSDTTYYNANKNADGIAFRAKDANGDGKTDYEVISENGIQVLYGL